MNLDAFVPTLWFFLFATGLGELGGNYVKFIANGATG